MSALRDLFEHPQSAPFIVGDASTHSYGETINAVRVAREFLTAKGIQPRDIVALNTNRDTTSIITLLALLEMGCSVLLTNSRWPDAMRSEAIERVAARHVVTATPRNELEVQSLPNPKSTPSWAMDAGVIVTTSGSTGIPKLALLSLSSLLASARAVAPACALTRRDRWLLSLPLFHVGGLGILFRALVTGSSVSLSPSQESCDDKETTHLSLVPTQLYRLLNDPTSRESLRSKRAVLLGGAPINKGIISRCLEVGIPVMTTYGLTEMCSAVTISSSPGVNDDSVSLGLPLPGREIKLSPAGEILTRGETLFQGYITPNGLSLPRVEGDWFPTGDIGAILPDGTLAIIARRDAQFISGGENIHPEMIENALTSLPHVIAACVVPVPDEEFGHRPYAFVVSELTTLDITETRESIRHLIPSFALPIGIQEAPQELLTASGKISRALAMTLANRTIR